jgi:very-short-patch-repair endonuclease
VTLQRRRLVALLDYAQQSLRTRSRAVSNVADHGSFLLFDHQAAGIDGIRLNTDGGESDDDVWLSVPRHRSPEVPPQSDSPWLTPWLNVGTATLDAPPLATEVEGGALIAAGTHREAGKPITNLAEAADPMIAQQERVRLSEYAFRAEVQAQHARYLEKIWGPWAQAERKRRQLSNLYVRLFTLQQELAGALIDGQLELVWGMGLGLAKKSGKTFAYPLVTRLVDLSFDAESQAAQVRPRDVDPRFEFELFAQAESSAVTQAEKAAEDFLANAAEPPSPFQPATYEPLLDIARRCLGMPHDSGDAPALSASTREDADEELKITNAWVLFARPRSTSVTMQDLERFRQLLNGLSVDAPLPNAVAALVTDPASENTMPRLPAYRGLSAAYHENALPEGASPEDLFFPKPFNDEQARIVQLLESADGVVVQGPPGTGKTHTIANIICHWLANGRRVLVTSMREPALDVLRGQLPEAIRPLAISLLASEQDGVNLFENSIQKIASEVQSLDAAGLGREIARLEETVNAFHARLKRIDTDLGRWAKLNLSRIEMEGEFIAPQDAAAEVAQRKGRFEWIPDTLGVGPQYAPRFKGEDIARLCEARSLLGLDIEYAGCSLPTRANFPDTLQLVGVHNDLQRFSAQLARARGAGLPSFAGMGTEGLNQAQALGERVARVKALRKEIAALRLPWAEELVECLKRGESAQAFTLLDALALEIGELSAQHVGALARPVVLPEAGETNPGFFQAVTNLVEGRRAFGLSSLFVKPEAARLLDRVRVSGMPPRQPEDWRMVLEHLALRKKRHELTARWNALAPELGFQAVLSIEAKGRLSTTSQIAIYQQARILVTEEGELCRAAMQVFPQWQHAAHAGRDDAALAELENALAQHSNSHRLAQIAAVVDGLHRLLEGKRGRIVEDLRQFLAKTLGNPAIEESVLLTQWSGLMAELERLDALAGPLSVIAEVTALIAASGAPILAQKLRQATPVEDDKLLAERLLRDWRLRRLATHLQVIDGQEEFKKLSAARAGVEHDLARAYHDLVVKRTWLKLAQNATPSVRAALQAYLNAIQRIGKGTGKRAFRYRRDARNAAAEAHRAVPCWIMPHHRVSESLPAQLGSFDLVVIDEASQSDLSALPILLRARKLLIVGDDRQVSPQAIGLEEERIKSLMRRHLAEQVPLYRAQMAPDRSIYDLAKVVFAHSGVMLKEHFRCVAPIIEYSKREFYAHELRPLRLPRTSERLDPPLLDYVVGEARRENGVNGAEVEFIVGEIKTLAADPKMRNRSVGVISLLGEDQAVRIWERLTEELGPDVMRRHALSCGDARMFQGRERDIVFLSMVCAPNDIGAPLSRDTFMQRFNVAASRARDRMILVRSVDLHQLSDADKLRCGLIAHFAKPYGEPPQRVTDLREICESPVERELFDWLNGEGYHVTPQVAVGAFRIDLVVEGSEDARLAIECDGDKYQGPQQWIEDMRRQRSLERVGWVFWRCFAAAWRRRREALLEDLRQALSAQGIEPVGRGGWGRRRMTQTRRVRVAESVGA